MGLGDQNESITNAQRPSANTSITKEKTNNDSNLQPDRSSLVSDTEINSSTKDVRVKPRVEPYIHKPNQNVDRCVLI